MFRYTPDFGSTEVSCQVLLDVKRSLIMVQLYDRLVIGINKMNYYTKSKNVIRSIVVSKIR